MFERFARRDSSRSRQNGSTGPGLAIVRAVVTGHGGTVDVSSPPGEGTTSTVRLPAATLAELEAGPALDADEEAAAGAPDTVAHAAAGTSR